MAFVNEHGLVLAAGDLAAVDAGDDALDHFGHLLAHRQVLGRQRLPIGHQLIAAPLVEVHGVHAVGNALGGHHAGQLLGQRFVVAEDEDGFAGRRLGLGQVFGPVAQQHGLAGAGHAVDHAVPLAQAARQLLLLQVHHAHDAGQLGLGVFGKQGALRWHAHVGEHDPAHAVHLRQRHGAADEVGEHLPQAALQVFGLHVFAHLVLADRAVRLQRVAEFGFVELRAGDVGQHHAVTPRKGQLALVAAIGVHELRVALQRADHLVGVLARLLQRVGNSLGAGVGVDDPGLPVDLDQRGKPVILDLQNQDAPARVHDHEIGVLVPGAYRHVVPEQVIGVQFLL